MVVVRLEPLKNWKVSICTLPYVHFQVYDSFLSKKTLEWASAAQANLEAGKATFITVGEFLHQDPECFAEVGIVES